MRWYGVKFWKYLISSYEKKISSNIFCQPSSIEISVCAGLIVYDSFMKWLQYSVILRHFTFVSLVCTIRHINSLTRFYIVYFFSNMPSLTLLDFCSQSYNSFHLLICKIYNIYFALFFTSHNHYRLLNSNTPHEYSK